MILCYNILQKLAVSVDAKSFVKSACSVLSLVRLFVTIEHKHSIHAEDQHFPIWPKSRTIRTNERHFQCLYNE